MALKGPLLVRVMLGVVGVPYQVLAAVRVKEPEWVTCRRNAPSGLVEVVAVGDVEAETVAPGRPAPVLDAS